MPSLSLPPGMVKIAANATVAKRTATTVTGGIVDAGVAFGAP